MLESKAHSDDIEVDDIFFGWGYFVWGEDSVAFKKKVVIPIPEKMAQNQPGLTLLIENLSSTKPRSQKNPKKLLYLHNLCVKMCSHNLNVSFKRLGTVSTDFAAGPPDVHQRH